MRKVKLDIRPVGLRLLLQDKKDEKFHPVAEIFRNRDHAHDYLIRNKITKPYRIQGIKLNYTNEWGNFSFTPHKFTSN